VTLIVLDGRTLFKTEESGDVDATHADGYFIDDVRHLSRWQLRVDGEPIQVLTSTTVDYFSARIVGSAGEPPTLAVRRDRFATDGLHEDIVLENLTGERQRARVELAFASDFADVMEAQEQGVVSEGRYSAEPGARSITLWNDRDGYRRGTRLSFSRGCRVSRTKATFAVTIPPRGSWQLCVDVTAIVDGRKRRPLLRCNSFGKGPPKMRVALEQWLREAPELECDQDALRHIYRRSLLDLAALRIRPARGMRYAMPGGGIPWFMTVFGRDSLIASYQALPFQADLAEATLEELAALQATEWDDFRDAEPGKILHELRHGPLAALRRIPHSPYYGAHDTAQLFLIVLDEYERWTGDVALVRRLEPVARAALVWLEGPADLDRDGYVEYRKRSNAPRALDNHCWKDSADSIRFGDGRLAAPPIATCELQGYAYDARLRTARLAREVWRDEQLAARLEVAAGELAKRFDRDFWSSRLGCHVLALDGEKRQVDSVTSNPGHLLWSGILPPRRAAAVVRRLLRPDVFSGFGLRSMSAEAGGYNPLGYHVGAVWPHDTALAAEGMRRYGFRDEAGHVLEGLLAAAVAFDHRLPEVFAGFERDATGVPVEYPDALSPQAWAAGAPLLALRTLLGLDVVDGKLRSDPHVPPELGPIGLRGVRCRGRRYDVP